MLTGATLAGADAQTLDHIMRIGEHMGLAFQLWDDIKDILPNNDGKPHFTDIAEGQPTVMTQHIMQTGTPAQQELLQKHFGKEVMPNDIEILRDLFTHSGALAKAQEHIQEHVMHSTAYIEKLSCTPAYKASLMGILDLFTSS